jgi:glycosyltransferase involved in cell wall biosynthesis
MMASGGRLEPVRRLLHGLRSPIANDTSPARFLQKDERQAFLRNKLEHSEFGVNLVGYAIGELGIGEDVRMLAKALETAGVPFTILNRQPGPEIREMDFSVAEHLSTETPYPITIIAMTGFDTALLWLDRPDLFESTYVIGFWPWELPDWPKEWDAVYDLVDEVWASTRYTQNAYAMRAPVPVKHVPMAVDLPRPSLLTRKDFGLDPKAFLFLFVFDFMSYPARKNPEGPIAAFREAFPQGNEKVGLVLKVSNRLENDPRWLSLLEKIQNDPRIRLFAENLARPDLIALTKACDAYISLHRAEGFGRTLAEAMLLEKAVVATNFSGNVDYLNETTGYPVACHRGPIQSGDYPFSDHQSWAEPDPGDAARHLKAIVGDPVMARRLGKAGKKRIASVHGLKIVGKNLRRHLEDIHLNVGNTHSLPAASPPIQNVQRKRTA